MASGAEGMTTETVAQALALSHGDHNKLSEFLTDYFASDYHECSSGIDL